MRVVVLIKSTQDRPEGDAKGESPTAAPRELAPCDLAALAWGRKLVSDPNDLTVLTAAPPSSDPVLQRALEHGAGRACRVWMTTPQDAHEVQPNPRAIGELLAATLERIGYDLVIAGSRSADWDSTITPAAVGFYLGVPHVSGVTEVEALTENEVRLTHPREHEVLSLKLNLPALIATCAGPGSFQPGQASEEVPPEIEVINDVDLAFELEDPSPYHELPADIEHSAPRRLANSEELLDTLRRWRATL
ncbi:MAG: hypothetical protein JRH20_04265 [Deltaproteobacteria bacterium]|nr:hypothetical protein [Deltaproteobacteria bacterium]